MTGTLSIEQILKYVNRIKGGVGLKNSNYDGRGMSLMDDQAKFWLIPEGKY